MTDQLSYEGRVVIVTGGGLGLGKAYCIAYAKRGAKVLVNDLGFVMDGKNQTPIRTADAVVTEIQKFGGTAMANYDSVENAEKIVQDTIKVWGRIDVVINNAGILRDKAFHNMKNEEWTQVLNVHLKGTFLMCRCVWPYMRQQEFGRIVNTSSGSGIYGNFGQANYSAAKLAIHGLTSTLAREGEQKNIFVNSIAPVAATRMTQGVLQSNLLDAVSVDHIVPFVEYLTHPDCTITGSLFEVGGGWAAKLRWERSNGANFDYPIKAEDIRERFEEIGDFSKDSVFPEDGNASIHKMFENFERNQKRLQANKTAATDLKSTPTFELMDAFLQLEGEKIVKICDAIYNFEILKAKGAPVDTCWLIDLKNGKGSVKQGRSKDAAATFTMVDSDYLQVVDGKLNPQMAFLQGKMKIKGNMKKATVFTPELFPKPTPENLAKYGKAKL